MDEIKLAIIKIKDALDTFPVIRIDLNVDTKEERVFKKAVRQEVAEMRYMFRVGIEHLLTKDPLWIRNWAPTKVDLPNKGGSVPSPAHTKRKEIK